MHVPSHIDHFPFSPEICDFSPFFLSFDSPRLHTAGVEQRSDGRDALFWGRFTCMVFSRMDHAMHPQRLSTFHTDTAECVALLILYQCLFIQSAIRNPPSPSADDRMNMHQRGRDQATRSPSPFKGLIFSHLLQ